MAGDFLHMASKVLLVCWTLLVFGYYVSSSVLNNAISPPEMPDVSQMNEVESAVALIDY